MIPSQLLWSVDFHVQESHYDLDGWGLGVISGAMPVVIPSGGTQESLRLGVAQPRPNYLFLGRLLPFSGCQIVTCVSRGDRLFERVAPLHRSNGAFFLGRGRIILGGRGEGKSGNYEVWRRVWIPPFLGWCTWEVIMSEEILRNGFYSLLFAGLLLAPPE